MEGTYAPPILENSYGKSFGKRPGDLKIDRIKRCFCILARQKENWIFCKNWIITDDYKSILGGGFIHIFCFIFIKQR